MFRCCVLVAAVILMTLSCSTQALIVPQELPSILSLVYSNIPPIRKGTDSRLGFGFRLGEHADFQVLVELGPQKETRPIGMNQDDDSSSSSKRQVNQNDYRKIRTTTTTTTTPRPPSTPTQPSNDYSWLRDWFSEWTGTKRKKPIPSANRGQNTNAINPTMKKGYIRTVPMIPESSLRQLQQLHKMATTMEPIIVEDTTPEPSSEELRRIVSRLNIMATRHRIPTPARKTKGEIAEELMNVDME